MTVDNSLDFVCVSQLRGINHTDVSVSKALVVTCYACIGAQNREYVAAIATTSCMVTLVKALLVDRLCVELGHISSKTVIECMVLLLHRHESLLRTLFGGFIHSSKLRFHRLITNSL